METAESTRLIAAVLSSKDVRDRGSAACQIIAGKDINVFSQMLDGLQQLSVNQYDRNILDLTVDVLIDNIGMFLPTLIRYCREQPNSQVGKSCIYLLGELAYKQCLYKKSALPDIGILDALISLLQHRETLEKETLSAVITAIKSYAYYGDVQSTQSVLDDLLSSCSKSSTPPPLPYPSLSDAIEILGIIHQLDKVTELKAQLAKATIPSWLATQIQGEIQELSEK